jgi:hypothetical protein
MMPRQTFRLPARDVAWQKQLRDRYAHEGTPPVPHLDLKRAEVRPVSRRLASQIILKYEWLGTMASTSHHYGLFFGAYCAGVTCFGFAAGANLYAHKPFEVERQELFYLARGACVAWAPPGANSKLVAWSCRLLGKATPAKLVIAYADTDAGEYGTIYQACNWVYIGLGASHADWIAPNGRVVNKIYYYDLARTYGGTSTAWRHRLEADGWQRQRSNPKYRYVAVLEKTDTRLCATIAALAQPYPKRAPSILADAPTVQVGESGAAPTGALKSL